MTAFSTKKIRGNFLNIERNKSENQLFSLFPRALRLRGRRAWPARESILSPSVQPRNWRGLKRMNFGICRHQYPELKRLRSRARLRGSVGVPGASTVQRERTAEHIAQTDLSGTHWPGRPMRGGGQTLDVSFSAVSKPNFTGIYSLESSRRDLQNALLCTALQSQSFANMFCKIN